MRITHNKDSKELDSLKEELKSLKEELKSLQEDFSNQSWELEDVNQELENLKYERFKKFFDMRVDYDINTDVYTIFLQIKEEILYIESDSSIQIKDDYHFAFNMYRGGSMTLGQIKNECLREGWQFVEGWQIVEE